MATVVRSNCMRQMATAGATPAARAPVVSRVTGAAMRTPGRERSVRAQAYYEWQDRAFSWEKIIEICGMDALDGYTVSKKGTPRSSSVSWIKPTPTPESDKPVVLYRDANSVCPYCERVRFALEYKGIPYDTIYIDLSNKPEWFADMSEGRVPAAFVNGDFFYDSTNIIMVLERQFPGTPPLLLPQESKYAEGLKDLINAANKNLLYSAVTAGAAAEPAPAKAKEVLQHAAELESILKESAEDGPFLCGEMSIVDVLLAPFLYRANVVVESVLGVTLAGNPDLPHFTKYLEAITTMPAYRKISLDRDSARVNFFAKRPEAEARIQHLIPESDVIRMAARREAAAKLAANYEYFLDLILDNSGMCRARTSPYGSTMTAPNGYPAKPLQATRSSIDFHLRRVGQYLTTGQVGPKGGNVEARCVGAIALVYLDNAVMAPRDMSAAAAEELREGIRAVLSHTY